MKKTTILLPLACSISVLFGHAAPTFAQGVQDMRVEPVMAVRHSAPGADAWYQLGRQHQEHDRLDHARDAFLQVLAENPAHIDARNALGAVYSMQGKLDEAVAEFQKVLQTQPALPYVYNNLGYAYYLKNDYPRAVIAFANALVLEPGNARAYGNLVQAWALLPSGPALAVLPKPAAVAVEAAAPVAVPPTAASEPMTAPAATAAAEAITVAGASLEHQPQAPQQQAQQPDPGAIAVSIEIANGTRDPQLAAYLAEALRREGVVVSRVTELKPFTQRRTVIFYRDGFREQALALSRAFALPAALENNTRSRAPSDTSDVRLVLGRSALEALQARPDMLAQANRP